MYGKSVNIQLFTDNSDHHYTRPMAKAAAEFFARHLMGNALDPELLWEHEEERIQPVSPSLLYCTKSGQVRGEIEGARFVHEENLERLEIAERLRNELTEQERKEKAFQ